MDFALTDEQKAVAELATKVFERRLTAEVRKEIEKSGDRFDATLWSQLADAGLLGVALRDDIGGAGHGLLELCSLLVAAGAACAPVPLWAVSIASLAIDQFGTSDQRALLQGVIAGETIIVPALAEPDGRDTRAPRTRATRTSAGWRLDGVKTCVPSATRAARLVVSATTADGPALFLAAASPVAQQVSTTGEIVGLVSFDDAPAEPLGDATAFEWMVERGNVGLCAMELGITEQVLRMTAAYTSQRVQFDRPVATFQAVAQRAADAWIDVESIRLTTWEAAWRLAAGLPAAREVAIAKFFAAEAGQRVTYACQHLHGGIGFDLDYPLAKYYPLSKQIELTLGGANAQLAWLGVLLAA